MNVIYLRQQEEERDFALQAAKHFSEHPNDVTFTLSAVEEGALFAVRWGLHDRAVLIIRVGENPVIYGDIITGRA